MKKWDIFIGAEPFIGTIENNSVFIDPDEKKLERLKENFSQGKHCVSCFFKKYTISADYKNLKWYLFSDNRFDGPLQLIDWNVNLPNLKEIESLELSGISLSDVLDQCLGKPLDNNLVSITIRNGNPLEVINSMNHWIDFVEEIKLENKYFISKWYEVFNNELFRLGYFNSKIKNNCWEKSYFSSELQKYKILKINFNNLDKEIINLKNEIKRISNELEIERKSHEKSKEELSKKKILLLEINNDIDKIINNLD